RALPAAWYSQADLYRLAAVGDCLHHPRAQRMSVRRGHMALDLDNPRTGALGSARAAARDWSKPPGDIFSVIRAFRLPSPPSSNRLVGHARGYFCLLAWGTAPNTHRGRLANLGPYDLSPLPRS